MVFSSGIFLFLFLPLVLIGVFLLRKRNIVWQNLFLLGASFAFYLKTGVGPFLLFLCSIASNYVLALIIAKRRKRIYLIAAVGVNMGLLFIFKYFSFVYNEFNKLNGIDELLVIALPLGISFYTFQALSYVIDVYKDSNNVEKNPINVALYISFFPQLVAGPIVRWDSIKDKLKKRTLNAERLNGGLARFAIGLGKKVIIADQMGFFADKAFALLKSNELTVGFAWMGAVAYTLQIYYDFSGYSDMAIGLGKILGFDFPENFNYPYISKSITEFWRRWHISLTSWFRDYIYIPLGGNRKGNKRTVLNMFIVWCFTGIWHGANYTFWIWGLIYFVLLMIEKFLLAKYVNFKNPFVNILKHVMTMICVMLLWVVFRADNLTDAGQYIGHMFGNGDVSEYAIGVTNLYFKNGITYFCLAFMGCIPWTRLIDTLGYEMKYKNVLKEIWIVVVFFISVCMVLESNYSPFIYFNF